MDCNTCMRNNLSIIATLGEGVIQREPIYSVGWFTKESAGNYEGWQFIDASLLHPQGTQGSKQEGPDSISKAPDHCILYSSLLNVPILIFLYYQSLQTKLN